MLRLLADENFNNDILFERGRPMPGVFEVSRAVSVGVAIEDLLLLAECSLDSEWEGQVRYLSLR